MLARYKIVRGKRPPHEPLPDGIRQDTRKHTRHFLRPSEKIVTDYLAQGTAAAWEKFSAAYLRILQKRFQENRADFEELAQLADRQDVYLGCSCPTAKNPDVNHCHTVLALRFMQEHFPELTVQFPQP
ncbi:MAG: hypothetical protein MI725_06660 [Pirellulales bacterium]|nr:hypothetical protein [Pirellulales bacterium]